jgi:methylenetetrahydrofolate reductase (NADPH)
MGTRVAELIAECSIELTPRDPYAGEALRALFSAGTVVFVNYPANVTYQDIVLACTRLQRAGFVAVPHVVARQLTGFTQATDFVHRLADAGVTEVLLLGGDATKPLGPFNGALDLLATGVLERHGIPAVAFAGYPEGHPHIDAAMLESALRAKLELARERGLTSSIVTQFAFEAGPVRRWIAEQRVAGVDSPIRVGVAGPASVATLAKYALRCGIGASLRALARGHPAIVRVLAEASPDALIEALVDDDTRIGGLHVFTFGGVQRTAAWRERALRCSVA